jgi:hypothetical protein
VTASLFSREDIFEIRRLFDAGMSPREIWRLPRFNVASLATVTRIARREVFREIGVGRTERPLVANRLAPAGRLPTAAAIPQPTFGVGGRPAPQAEPPPNLGSEPTEEELQALLAGITLPPPTA